MAERANGYLIADRLLRRLELPHRYRQTFFAVSCASLRQFYGFARPRASEVRARFGFARAGSPTSGLSDGIEDGIHAYFFDGMHGCHELS